MYAQFRLQAIADKRLTLELEKEAVKHQIQLRLGCDPDEIPDPDYLTEEAKADVEKLEMRVETIAAQLDYLAVAIDETQPLAEAEVNATRVLQ